MRLAAVSGRRPHNRLSRKGTMIKKLRIIHLDDDFFSASLIQTLLAEEGFVCDIERVETEGDFSVLLERGEFDLVLAELTLPAFSGMTALAMSRERYPDLPFIFVTDTMGEEVAIESLKSGATDYVLKCRLSRLAPAVRRALREKEEREKRGKAVKAMDGYWLFDMQGRILEVNETLCRISGYNAQELLSKRISEMEIAETADEVAAHLQKIMAQGEDRFETRLRRKDGSIFDVEVSAQFQPIEGGRVVAFIRDITERKLAEEEHKKMNADIEQFIYTVSHDLRSPLVTVKTFMGFLEKDMAEGNQEQLNQDIQFIHSATDKMKLLLDELVELSRIGRVETTPLRVSFMEVVTEVTDAMADIIKENAVDIHIPDTELMLFGDRPRLCQIWQNLIENAIRYRSVNSIVCIELGVQQVSGETVFFVKDNGIGIAPEYHAKIFGIFEKLDPKSPGAGLGLTMVQRIVEKCGGRIWVESEGIGKGACFFFTLPQAVLQS